MSFFILPVKLAVIGLLIRVIGYLFHPIIECCQPVLVCITLLSVYGGSILAVDEKSIRSFLVYISISHIGFILVGLCCGTIYGYLASMFYLLTYTITNYLFLVFFVNFKKNPLNKPISKISDFSNCIHQNRGTAYLMLIILFSMAGMPPFIGFYGKYYVLSEVFNSNIILIAISCLVSSLISCYYYLVVIHMIFFEKSFFTISKSSINNYDYAVGGVIIMILTIFVIVFSISSNIFIDHFMITITLICCLSAISRKKNYSNSRHKNHIRVFS